MRKIILLVMVIFSISGCANMTPVQKRNTAIAVGVVIIAGAIVASQDGDVAMNQNCYVLVPPGVIEKRVC